MISCVKDPRKIHKNSSPVTLIVYDLLPFLKKRPYIKYVEKGAWRVFVGIMKYFRQILMGNEIFFKVFDGPQNIFLCSIFVILFFKLRGWSTNIQTSHKGYLRKTRHVKQITSIQKT